MNTKTLMVASSVFLGLLGLLSLFVPEELLKLLSLPFTSPLPVVIQLAGALYCSFALMNWTAKDNIIGGIYLRPISLANFAHFMIGALSLLKYQLSDAASAFLWVVLIFYAVFAIIFTWLVFFHTGIENRTNT
jgi:hypothetical protein